LISQRFALIIPPFSGFRGWIDMVVIRLARSGAKKRPFYNMVVADSRDRRDGRFIERVGYYNPVAPAHDTLSIAVNAERVAYWQSQGAQLSPTVARLVKQVAKAAAAAAPAPAAA